MYVCSVVVFIFSGESIIKNRKTQQQKHKFNAFTLVFFYYY
jgi:hypothetical protein